MQNRETNCKTIYRIGAIAAIIVIIGTVSDIIIGTSLGGDLTMIPEGAAARFIQFQDKPLLLEIGGLWRLKELPPIGYARPGETTDSGWEGFNRDRRVIQAYRKSDITVRCEPIRFALAVFTAPRKHLPEQLEKLLTGGK